MSNANFGSPKMASLAQFDANFGQKFLLTVDTEEEFDWGSPFDAQSTATKSAEKLAEFQEFCEGFGVTPIYVVDWPIANSKPAQEILGAAAARGKAEIGVHLHPWVSPPFQEEVNTRNSYAGNLPPELEAEKFHQLRDRIEQNFQVKPRIFRAGRYGFGAATAQILRDGGIMVDSSARAHFNYTGDHGPDYSRHPLTPYWVEGSPDLLELPLTTVFWGMLRKLGPKLYPLVERIPHMNGVLSRSKMLERIALTPEGVSAAEAMRAVDVAVKDRLPVLMLSFHSPSLQPGHTPYVRSENDLSAFYDWFRQIFTHMKAHNVAPGTLDDILGSVQNEAQNEAQKAQAIASASSKNISGQMSGQISGQISG